MKVLVTGANGFVGKNLCVKLAEMKGVEVSSFKRGDSLESLFSALKEADFVFHLAGENRPKDENAFERTNVELTKTICDFLQYENIRVPILFSSSIQAVLDNRYGRSKRAAEILLEELNKINGNPVSVYRLPGVFGKWCRPNYNSVVATFCHNIANDLPIRIDNPDALVRLVYIDDLTSSFISCISDDFKNEKTFVFKDAIPEYKVRVGAIAEMLNTFRSGRDSLVTERVGNGFTRALYSTYVSYLPKDSFSYGVPVYKDERGVFVEMLKTHDSGQFSYFTAHPGVTRGGHYHHTKTEKFLVIKGTARFGFRNIISNEMHSIDVCGDEPKIVETIPGWTHDITNIGSCELVVMLWANEVFSRENPDTVTCRVNQ